MVGQLATSTFTRTNFEDLTPNLLATTVETIEGGGLQTVTSLKQLYAMSLDVHERHRTEAHGDVVGCFNERYKQILISCYVGCTHCLLGFSFSMLKSSS
ncbi:N-acetyltransferase 10 [Zootermopsis nevadensis]|uniref:N-acetyltransferase 10 n=1 Tax=Zootermopsis nevadensis TaxID=136037 RepID=A0A067R1V6_ZOONE|nr:N-acetyltransferase 10 [Zootermopsis nevadensis]